MADIGFASSGGLRQYNFRRRMEDNRLVVSSMLRNMHIAVSFGKLLLAVPTYIC
jgi:hypothetical protein